MTCWFCGVKEAESKKSVHFYMYGEIKATDPEENKKRIEYSTKKIDVPRCADCKKKHAQARTVNVFLVVILALLAAGAVAAIFSLVGQWLWGFVLGFGAGVVLVLFIHKGYILKGIKLPSAAKKSFPQVKDLLAKGYKFGKNPSYEESVQAKAQYDSQHADMQANGQSADADYGMQPVDAPLTAQEQNENSDDI